MCFVICDVLDFGDGEVFFEVDKFVLIVNNVMYVVVGDQIGYWQFFFVGGGVNDFNWGIVFVWGFGNVFVLKFEDVLVGECFYGYFLMVIYLVIKLGKVCDCFLIDMVEYCVVFLLVYNNYSWIVVELEVLQMIENEWVFFFLFFMMLYFFYDYFVDNEYFGVEQVIFGLVLLKIVFGFVYFLYNNLEGGE